MALAPAELYDPRTGTWSATGSMTMPRARHTATLLRNGKVLVAGGYCPSPPTPRCSRDVHKGARDLDGALATAELHDPKTGTWTGIDRMITARMFHTATLLADGSVIVAGAEHSSGILASSEIYDPATGKWTAVADMTTARTQQMAARLPDGTVLVAGGHGHVASGSYKDLVSAEIYDPVTRNWSVTGSMATARTSDPLTVLADGKVLKTSGGGPADPVPSSSELYHPSSRTWSATGGMTRSRWQLSATRLSDGRVLVAGGFDAARFVASTELHDPTSGTWSSAGSLKVPRWVHTAALLRNDKILLVGGVLDDGVTSSAVLYDPTR